MPEAIKQWLEQLGLERYARAFEKNAIGIEHLGDLDHAILKEIGVRAAGHRITILKAAAGTPDPAQASAQPPARTESVTARVSAGAEHRHLSVMFCDLVGSTALSERLELETYRELLGAYQDAARAAIQRYDGYIARYMGDGLLVYFGYPVANEDDAERAVRAGLDVVEAIGECAARLDVDLHVRIGIASGQVVAGDIVGEGASEEHAVLGKTPNLAARLQGLAAPDTVLISESTKRLVEGRFDLEALAPRRVRGLHAPVRAFRAQSVRASSRFEAATSHGLSDLVGRRSEIELLLDRWELARAGEGQVMLLSGEAGIGKSRMLRVLRDRLRDEPYTALRYQCSPYGGTTAFSAIVEELQRSAGFSREDTAPRRLDKLERLLSARGDDVAATAPLIANLLSLPGDRYPPLSMTPQRQKLETIAILGAQLERLAGRQPVLVLVEDAHWIDPSTLDTLDVMIERSETLRVLVLVTYRPGFEAPWGHLGHVTRHSLNRLGRADGKALCEQLAGGRTLPDTVLGRILAHTDGVPLFIEELTKTVLEAGLLREANGHYVLDGPLPPLAIPETLKDSLMARLDGLASAKLVAQAAACIGREFSAALLGEALQRDSVEEELERLLGAGLVFRRGAPEDGIFVFKHALVQDTAYESLLAGNRRHLHARIARALEASPDPDPAALARHYSAAGLAQDAARCFLAAGTRALSVSALPEASGEFELGLREIEAMAPSPIRDRIELDLRTALGTARVAYFGWAHPSVGEAYEPAFELAEMLGDERASGAVLWGLCVHYWCRAEFPPTHRWLARLEDAADRSRNVEFSLVRDMTAGCQYFWEADYDRAFRYTSHARETYDERRHAAIARYTNHDPLTFSLHWAGSLLQWIIGHPDRARELAEEAHALARRIGHPFNSAFALTAGSEGLLLRGDTEQVLACCDEVQEIVDAEGLGEFAQHVLVNNWRGRALVQIGDYETGYRLTKLATTHWREAEGKICSALFWRGEALGLAGLGRTPEAIALLDDAIAHCRTTGDRFMEPEVLRVKADLMPAAESADTGAAESILRESLRVARDHGARSWELRAGTSLARLLRERDAQAEARALLGPIYSWFSEGFDTADLREARALLEELF